MRNRRRNLCQVFRGWPAAAFLQVCVLVPVLGESGDSHACGSGLTIRLSSNPTQGSLVLVEAHSGLRFADVNGEWKGQKLRFWQDLSATAETAYRALLAVDLEQAAGESALSVKVKLDSNEQLACRVPVTVEEAQFPTERLRVARQFLVLSSEDLERVKRESEQLRALFATVTADRLWSGGFQLPVEGVPAVKNFGYLRVLNDQPRAPHSGEDFPARIGTPIRASQRGRVMLAEELFFSGKTVVLDHGLGLYTLYAHLESITVSKGAIVEAGAVLGTLGATGRVTGAHLHWAVRLNEARVNPWDLLDLLSE